MKIKTIDKSKHGLQAYLPEASAGMELRANIDGNLTLKPILRKMVFTLIFLEIPADSEAQTRQRIGLVINNSIKILNSALTINDNFKKRIS